MQGFWVGQWWLPEREIRAVRLYDGKEAGMPDGERVEVLTHAVHDGKPLSLDVPSQDTPGLLAHIDPPPASRRGLVAQLGHEAQVLRREVEQARLDGHYARTLADRYLAERDRLAGQLEQKDSELDVLAREVQRLKRELGVALGGKGGIRGIVA